MRELMISWNFTLLKVLFYFLAGRVGGIGGG